MTFQEMFHNLDPFKIDEEKIKEHQLINCRHDARYLAIKFGEAYAQLENQMQMIKSGIIDQKEINCALQILEENGAKLDSILLAAFSLGMEYMFYTLKDHAK